MSITSYFYFLPHVDITHQCAAGFRNERNLKRKFVAETKSFRALARIHTMLYGIKIEFSVNLEIGHYKGILEGKPTKVLIREEQRLACDAITKQEHRQDTQESYHLLHLFQVNKQISYGH